MVVEWKHTETCTGVWQVSFCGYEGGYELTGPFPVQAVGSIEGIDICFVAKYDAWEFEANDETGGLFSADDHRAFQRSGGFQGASQMPFLKAAKIISHCLGEFIDQITWDSSHRKET